MPESLNITKLIRDHWDTEFEHTEVQFNRLTPDIQNKITTFVNSYFYLIRPHTKTVTTCFKTYYPNSTTCFSNSVLNKITKKLFNSKMNQRIVKTTIIDFINFCSLNQTPQAASSSSSEPSHDLNFGGNNGFNLDNANWPPEPLPELCTFNDEHNEEIFKNYGSNVNSYINPFEGEHQIAHSRTHPSLYPLHNEAANPVNAKKQRLD